jgi:hypothetical protein
VWGVGLALLVVALQLGVPGQQLLAGHAVELGVGDHRQDLDVTEASGGQPVVQLLVTHLTATSGLVVQVCAWMILAASAGVKVIAMVVWQCSQTTA